MQKLTAILFLLLAWNIKTFRRWRILKQLDTSSISTFMLQKYSFEMVREPHFKWFSTVAHVI